MSRSLQQMRDPKARNTGVLGRWGRAGAALIMAGTLALSGLGTTGAFADSDERTIDNASFEWGLNAQHQLAAAAGGCDYFSAGVALGASAQYTTRDGNVQIIKRNASGVAAAVGIENRCTPNSADAGAEIGQRLLFSKGTGTTKSATGETTISWQGSATVNAYGGLATWVLTDPTLKVAADGKGTLSAKVTGTGGAGATNVVLADFTGVTVTGTGITATPVFAGVDYFPLNDDGTRASVSAITDAMKAQRPDWGSWPQSFVDFQYKTGLSSYWHTSGLSADPKKAPLPVTFLFAADDLALAPTIVRNPVSQTVSTGSDVTFEAAAAGSPAPTLQWQTLQAGGSWTDVPGANGSSFTLQSVPLSSNGMRVRAVARNSVADTPSAEATLSVEAPASIVITQQPQSVTARIGSMLTFSVTVTGSTPEYQWQRSTDGGNTWANWGRKLATVQSFSSSFANNGDQYRVRVSNGLGSSVLSDVATVTLTGEAVAVTQNPADSTGFVGGKATFSVEGSGLPAPKWQWQRSTDGGDTWEEYPSGGGTALYVKELALDMSGNLFRAVASNPFGEDAVSAPAKLTVIPQTERSVLYTPSAEIDPAVDTVLSLSGAGFQVADDFKGWLRIGVMEAGVWGDGANPNAVNFVNKPRVLLGSLLRSDAGAFATTSTIPANTLDPNKTYLLVSFSSVAGDTSLNNAVPLVLKGQKFGESQAPKVLENPSTRAFPASDLGLSEVEFEGEATVKNLEPQTWYFATVYSDPTALGWYRTDSSGSFTVKLPSSVQPGQHSFQVQNVAGIFRAWQSFTVKPVTPVVVGPVTPPVGPVNPLLPGSKNPSVPQNRGNGSGSASQTQRQSAGKLSVTGDEAGTQLIATVAAAGTALIGASLLVLARRRRVDRSA